MTIENMRNEIKKSYGPNWAIRVDRMSNKQVAAIYYKFKKEGILGFKKVKTYKEQPRQLSMFNIIDRY